VEFVEETELLVLVAMVFPMDQRLIFVVSVEELEMNVSTNALMPIVMIVEQLKTVLGAHLQVHVSFKLQLVLVLEELLLFVLPYQQQL